MYGRDPGRALRDRQTADRAGADPRRQARTCVHDVDVVPDHQIAQRRDTAQRAYVLAPNRECFVRRAQRREFRDETPAGRHDDRPVPVLYERRGDLHGTAFHTADIELGE